MANLTLRLSEELHQRAIGRAEEMDRSLNWLISEAVSSYLGTGKARDVINDRIDNEVPTGSYYCSFDVRCHIPNIGDGIDVIVEELQDSLIGSVKTTLGSKSEEIVDVEVRGPQLLAGLPYDVRIRTCNHYQDDCWHKHYS